MEIDFSKSPYELRRYGYFEGKEWEYEDKVTLDGRIYHKITGLPCPVMAVSIFAIANGEPERLKFKPAKFTGRRVWAFGGRGYAYECIVEGEQHLISQFIELENVPK